MARIDPIFDTDTALPGVVATVLPASNPVTSIVAKLISFVIVTTIFVAIVGFIGICCIFVVGSIVEAFDKSTAAGSGYVSSNSNIHQLSPKVVEVTGKNNSSCAIDGSAYITVKNTGTSVARYVTVTMNILDKNNKIHAQGVGLVYDLAPGQQAVVNIAGMYMGRTIAGFCSEPVIKVL